MRRAPQRERRQHGRQRAHAALERRAAHQASLPTPCEVRQIDPSKIPVAQVLLALEVGELAFVALQDITVALHIAQEDRIEVWRC